MNFFENAFQREERQIRDAEQSNAQRLGSDPKTMLSFAPCPQSGAVLPKPMATARELGQPVPDDMVEMQCDACGGTGWDPGSLDPFGEYCPTCQGSKVEYVSLKKLIEMGIDPKELKRKEAA